MNDLSRWIFFLLKIAYCTFLPLNVHFSISLFKHQHCIILFVQEKKKRENGGRALRPHSTSDDKELVKWGKLDWVYMFEGMGKIRLTAKRRFI